PAAAGAPRTVVWGSPGWLGGGAEGGPGGGGLRQAGGGRLGRGWAPGPPAWRSLARLFGQALAGRRREARKTGRRRSIARTAAQLGGRVPRVPAAAGNRPAGGHGIEPIGRCPLGAAAAQR